MNRKITLCAVLLIFGLVVGTASAGDGKRVLLLVDMEGAGTDSLVEALVGNGHEVVQFSPEHEWNGTNPSLAGFDVVVHLNGSGFLDPSPASAQIALNEFVRNGGGYVGAQFNGFEAAEGEMNGMLDLVLQLWGNDIYDQEVNWARVPDQGDHPVLVGIPDSMSFYAGAHDAAPLVEFEDDPSTVLMTSESGGPAVIVREFECGRVVSFSIAPNYFFERVMTLTVFEIQQLYLNAVAWSGSSECVPASFDGLLTEIRNLVKARKLAWWRGVFLGLTVRTAEFYYDRGHTEIAVNFLWGFTFKVERMIRRRQLAEEDGGPLVDAARRLIEEISGP